MVRDATPPLWIPSCTSQTDSVIASTTLRLDKISSALQQRSGLRDLGKPFGDSFRVLISCGKEKPKEQSPENTDTIANKCKDERFIGLFLSLEASKNKEEHHVTIELKTLQGITIEKRSFVKSFNGEKVWGFSNFISHSTIEKRSPEVLKEDACLVVAYVSRYTILPLPPEKLAPILDIVYRSTDMSTMRTAGLKFLLWRRAPKDSEDIKAVGFLAGDATFLARKLPYFAAMSGFLESKQGLTRDVIRKRLHPFSNSEYGYESDSDLDDDEEDGSDSDDEEGPPLKIAKTAAITGEKRKRAMSSKASGGKPELNPGGTSTQEVELADQDTPSPGSADLHAKVILVKDIAYKTWFAMIVYLYTDVIQFAPLRRISDKNKGPLRRAVSCKSVYRLADKIGLKSLEDHAFNHLRSQMSNEVVLQELLLSSFSWRYERVMNMQLEYVFKHWDELQEQFKILLPELLSGKYPHAAPIIASILGKTKPT